MGSRIPGYRIPGYRININGASPRELAEAYIAAMPAPSVSLSADNQVTVSFSAMPENIATIIADKKYVQFGVVRHSGMGNRRRGGAGKTKNVQFNNKRVAYKRQRGYNYSGWVQKFFSQTDAGEFFMSKKNSEHGDNNKTGYQVVSMPLNLVNNLNLTKSELMAGSFTRDVSKLFTIANKTGPGVPTGVCMPQASRNDPTNVRGLQATSMSYDSAVYLEYYVGFICWDQHHNPKYFRMNGIKRSLNELQ